MNAYSTTTRDIANALIGTSRAMQDVHVSSTLHSGSPFGPRHVVLIIPEGSRRGNYYECGDRSLALLRSGMTPEDLELEPLTDDECDAVDNSTYWGD